jgi:hypothetical protein
VFTRWHFKTQKPFTMKKIKALLNDVSIWVKKTLEKGDYLLRKHGEVAVRVTQALKNAVESPVVKTIVDLTPTDLDNKWLGVAQRIMPKVAFHVALTSKLIDETATQEEAVRVLQEYIKTLAKDGRIKFWADFSAWAMVFLQDGKLSWKEANQLTQMYHSEYYPKAA